ncbi:MAG: MFS transporter [Acidobacteriota bacterium]
MGVRIPARLRHTFRALRHRQFRIYWLGQGVSVTGTWMQTMAQGWLVYRLTDSPLALGVLSAARFGPSLLGSPIAGVITDRFSRHRLVLLTQTLGLAQASVMAALTLAGVIEVWHVLLLALLQGVVDTLDMPARQTLQVDLVGLDDLQSAVSLNSTAFNGGRMVGPAIAGMLVSMYGEGVCFLANALSYLAVLIALHSLRLGPGAVAGASSVRAELLEGVRFAWHERRVRRILLAVSVTSCLGLSYSSLLPVFARDVLHGGANGYGALLAGAGLGAIAGALLVASRRQDGGTDALIALAQAGLGLGLLALASTRSLALAVTAMVFIGLAVAVQLATTNGLLQTTAPPALRGRVLSLYIWLFAGLAPVGGLAAGAAAESVGAAWTAAAAGVACLVSALLAAAGAARRRAGGAVST